MGVFDEDFPAPRELPILQAILCCTALQVSTCRYFCDGIASGCFLSMRHLVALCLIEAAVKVTIYGRGLSSVPRQSIPHSCRAPVHSGVSLVTAEVVYYLADFPSERLGNWSVPALHPLKYSCAVTVSHECQTGAAKR